jgi:HK97 family phage major capsid protein
MEPTTTPAAPPSIADEITRGLAKPAPAPARTDAEGNRLSSGQQAVVQKVFGGTPTPPESLRGAPHIVRPSALGDKPFMMTKAIKVASGRMSADQAAYECHVSKQLRDQYVGSGDLFESQSSVLVPYAVDHLPEESELRPHTAEVASFRKELKERMVGGAYLDRDEMSYALKKGLISNDLYQKTLTVGDDASMGGVRGYPVLGELVDLQRAQEILGQLPVTRVTLGATGMFEAPRLKRSVRTDMTQVGEDRPAPVSNNPRLEPKNISLRAKRMSVIAELSDYAVRFTTPSVESIVRMDFAEGASEKRDELLFYGRGGEEVLGLELYETMNEWVQDQFKILNYVPARTAPDGNTPFLFLPEDAALMEANLADRRNITAWVMRRRMFMAAASFRSGAAAATDQGGLFVFNAFDTTTTTRRTNVLNGSPVVTSQTIRGTETRGSATGLTTIWGGDWKDLLLGEIGVLEIETSNQQANAWATGGLSIRAIQWWDARPRDEKSFIKYKQVKQGY